VIENVYNGLQIINKNVTTYNQSDIKSHT